MARDHEIHLRAANLADLATSILSSNGVDRATVIVTFGPWINHPLAIRTPVNDGFGASTDLFARQQRQRLADAQLQAEYQLTAGGRTAQAQEDKLAQAHRNAASYHPLLSGSTKARFAHYKDFGLTLVVSSDQIEPTDAARLSEGVIAKIDRGVGQIAQPPAVRLVTSCLESLSNQLPDDRTGFVMIGSPLATSSQPDSHTSRPVIICSQSGGLAVEPANFAVVSAKVRAVAVSGEPSGPNVSPSWYHVSRIPGAIPVEIRERGQRIIAVGGLPDGEADVRVIEATINSQLGKELGVRKLNRINR